MLFKIKKLLLVKVVIDRGWNFFLICFKGYFEYCLIKCLLIFWILMKLIFVYDMYMIFEFLLIVIEWG